MIDALAPFTFDPAGLRHRIEILRPILDSEEPWQEAEGFEQLAELWAGILDLSAGERVEADQRATGTALHFVIRHRTDLEGRLRLTHQGKSYDILSIQDPDQRGRWLVLEALSALGHE